MNIQLITIFALQIFISLITSILYLILYYSKKEQLNYIFSYNSEFSKEPKSINLFIKLGGTWILIFTNFVPISLLVTLETVKFIQAMSMSWDIDMFDKERDIGMKVQTSTINEELGQVKFIFSDKTGTLTKNYMQFKCLSIGDKIYGDMENNNNDNKNPILKDNYGDITNCKFYDINNEFNIDLNQNLELINHFMLCLCLCNSVLIDNKKYDKDKIIEYQASSPDEKALIYFARSQGYIFLNRTIKNEIILEIKGEKKTYEILNELEYSSERKRMSIICKDPETNKIILYSKGADSMIESLL
jgi:phospholipid-transporting ATPase